MFIERIGWLVDRVREVLWDLGVLGIAGAVALGLSFLSLVETFVATVVGLLSADVPDDETIGGILSSGRLSVRIGNRVVFFEPLITRALVFVTVLTIVAIFVDRARQAELELDDLERGEEP